MMTPAGRPRSPAADVAVGEAVRRLLASLGYQALSIEAVAASAGISKATIYRRWPSKAEMVFAVVVHDQQIHLPSPPHSLDRDVAALVEHVVGLLSTTSAKHALPGLLADIESDARLADRFHQAFIAPQRHLVAELLASAVKRGELTHLPDVTDVHALILGAVFTRVFLLAEPPPADLCSRITHHVLISLPRRGKE